MDATARLRWLIEAGMISGKTEDYAKGLVHQCKAVQWQQIPGSEVQTFWGSSKAQILREFRKEISSWCLGHPGCTFTTADGRKQTMAFQQQWGDTDRRERGDLDPDFCLFISTQSTCISAGLYPAQTQSARWVKLILSLHFSHKYRHWTCTVPVSGVWIPHFTISPPYCAAFWCPPTWGATRDFEPPKNIVLNIGPPAQTNPIFVNCLRPLSLRVLLLPGMLLYCIAGWNIDGWMKKSMFSA